MLVSELHLLLNDDIFIRIISIEGHTYAITLPASSIIEALKSQTIEYFYTNGERNPNEFKLVHVGDTRTLRDFLTLEQESVKDQDELVLVERRLPEAGVLWDLGNIRSPSISAIAAATASVPSPIPIPRRPELQTLLPKIELSHELRKILISLVETGARLAAGSRFYKISLDRLSAALDTSPQAATINSFQNHIEDDITPFNEQYSTENNTRSNLPIVDDAYKRAQYLKNFLDRFREWRQNVASPTNTNALASLLELGFAEREAADALRVTGFNESAAAMWLVGERRSSMMELVDGLPEGVVLRALLEQPQVQRGLLNTRMLLAFIAMIGDSSNASLWLNAPHGGPLLGHILRTYHAEKYCVAANQFAPPEEDPGSTSRDVS